MPKRAGSGSGTERPAQAGLGLEDGRPGPGSFARRAGVLLILVLPSTSASLSALAQDDGGPAEPTAVYVNTELLERLAAGRAAASPRNARQPRPLLQAPPSWQLRSRLYVVPPGQAGPAAPTQAPPAPSVLTSELEALEGGRSGGRRSEAEAVRPRDVPARPAETAATPPPDEETAASALGSETAGGQVPAPLPAEPPGSAEAPPSTAEIAAPASPLAQGPAGAPPAPAAILGELAEAATREASRSGRITAPPVPEPPAPPGAATPAARDDAAPPATVAAAPEPEKRLGPAAPAAKETDSQISARTPVEVPLKGRILFEAGSTQLSPEARGVLEGVAGRLLAAEAEAVELRAYATGRDPRRLSLSRGLVARGYLETLGVEAEKVFLRPLGDQAAEGPVERIDYELVTP
ncbi:MAG: hypothetical protein MI785_24610 [Kiloniellales bacterium]|nr:hypothetical protein [Kiloniellales bacterium]